LNCTILQLGLHIQLFGLHKIGWTAPLEYALLLSLERQHGQLVVDALFNRQPVQRMKQRVDV